MTIFTYTSKDLIDYVTLIDMKQSYNMSIFDFTLSKCLLHDGRVSGLNEQKCPDGGALFGVSWTSLDNKWPGAGLKPRTFLYLEQIVSGLGGSPVG